jgi:hypothetical protein
MVTIHNTLREYYESVRKSKVLNLTPSQAAEHPFFKQFTNDTRKVVLTNLTRQLTYIDYVINFLDNPFITGRASVLQQHVIMSSLYVCALHDAINSQPGAGEPQTAFLSESVEFPDVLEGVNDSRITNNLMHWRDDVNSLLEKTEVDRLLETVQTWTTKRDEIEANRQVLEVQKPENVFAVMVDSGIKLQDKLTRTSLQMRFEQISMATRAWLLVCLFPPVTRTFSLTRVPLYTETPKG